jgi:hypothetical protein
MTLPKVVTVPLDTDAALQGDPRGAYGFGRPAHGTDPQATYSFTATANPSTPLAEHLDEVASDFADTDVLPEGDLPKG